MALLFLMSFASEPSPLRKRNSIARAAPTAGRQMISLVLPLISARAAMAEGRAIAFAQRQNHLRRLADSTGSRLNGLQIIPAADPTSLRHAPCLVSIPTARLSAIACVKVLPSRQRRVLALTTRHALFPGPRVNGSLGLRNAQRPRSASALLPACVQMARLHRMTQAAQESVRPTKKSRKIMQAALLTGRFPAGRLQMGAAQM